MRFIFNFFFFGMLFFLIYYFFPDAFNTMVGWANQVFAFFHNLFMEMKDKASHTTSQSAEPAKALFLAVTTQLFWK